MSMPAPLRGGWSFALVLTILVSAEPVVGASDEMIQVTDLGATASDAKARKLLLVLEFSSDSCHFCRKLEQLFLLPMQRNAAYDDKILIRSISLDPYETVIDFDGKSTSTSLIADRYGVTVTPTLLFLGPDGEELSERLVGIWSEDFYGAFIDNRIDGALTRL